MKLPRLPLPLLAAALCACAARGPRPTLPADSASPAPLRLELAAGNGTVAPAYRYDYRLTVADTAGTLAWRPGYGRADTTWTAAFTVPRRALSRVLSALTAAGVPGRQWTQAPRRIGGGYTRLSGEVDGQRFEIPDALSPADEAAARKLYDAVSALAPDSMWTAMRARQQALQRQVRP